MNGGCSDIWLGQLEGNDNYPEVFVGRFSAESVADVQNQVAKVIYYERDMPADADWLGKGIGIGSTEGAGSGHNGGESDYIHMEYIRDTLMHYTYSDVSRHYLGVGVGTNATMLSADFNAGAGICNYCNHGSVTGWKDTPRLEDFDIWSTTFVSSVGLVGSAGLHAANTNANANANTIIALVFAIHVPSLRT